MIHSSTAKVATMMRAVIKCIKWILPPSYEMTFERAGSFGPTMCVEQVASSLRHILRGIEGYWWIIR